MNVPDLPHQIKLESIISHALIVPSFLVGFHFPNKLNFEL